MPSHPVTGHGGEARVDLPVLAACKKSVFRGPDEKGSQYIGNVIAMVVAAIKFIACMRLDQEPQLHRLHELQNTGLCGIKVLKHRCPCSSGCGEVVVLNEEA
jgi:hypothetical protein